ncbi:hypothetical protein GCM10009654_31370 [Streptomyces hebeiensis]|uniref:Uncharacterized protein n=2 Tax=Streptomyces hebeiensis TaxID=229486 RepID=A0ABN1UV51_9ACTN
MDFILMTEGDTPVGLTHEHRFRGAFLDDVFSYVGDHYKIPPRSLVPKPLQGGPYPPIPAAAGSPNSVEKETAR